MALYKLQFPVACPLNLKCTADFSIRFKWWKPFR